jgi:hypothetical protein
MIDAEVIMKKDSLEMMRRPRLWPITGMLPLRHRSEKAADGMPRLAVLFWDGHKYTILRDANLYTLDPDEPREEVADEWLEAINREWIVD